MDCEFVTDRDKRFMEDNILDGEVLNTSMANDLTTNLLDFESLYSASDDLMPSLPNDLQFGIFDELDMSTIDTVPADFWKELSDSNSSDSGFESVSIKSEPLSSASSSCSEASSDSGHFPLISTDTSSCLIEMKSPKLELMPVLQSDAWLAPELAMTSATPDTPPQSPVRPIIDTKPVMQPAPVNVVGSKVNIQPRPEAVTQQPQSKPLILTPAEFAQLTAQGVLKFHCPSDSMDCDTPTVPALPPRVCTPATMPRLNGTMDIKVVKRQQRMIKNRESACLSRKRKKEYLSGLEQQLQESAYENEKLKGENELLKSRLLALQSENESLKKASGLKKTTMVVLAVVFVFGLNLGPLRQFGSWQPPDIKPQSTAMLQTASVSHHLSRTLLSYDDSGDEERRPDRRADGLLPNLANVTEQMRASIDSLRQSLRQADTAGRNSLMGGGVGVDGEGVKSAASVCPSDFNRTESLRLLNELTGWVQGHEEAWTRKARDDNSRPSQRKQYKPPRYLRAAMKGQLRKYQQPPTPYLNEAKEPYEVQVFTGSAESSYQKFLKVIHRRNDTFYVISFRQDHYLLPATATNKTMRPRMSLMMPAVGLNATMQPPDGSMAMMQIDCEVVGTRLVYVQHSAIPAHLRPNDTRPVSQPPARPQRRRDKRPRPDVL